jgi:PHP family Zn ribbon phosphoesterase
MQVIADLQLHSKYSRAVSPQMVIPQISAWAKRKGIGLVATGDWTHPLWMKEIKENLEEMGNGLLRLRTETANKNLDPSSVARKTISSAKSPKASEAGQNFVRSPYADPLFLLATEVSCIYSQGGKGRRIHTLIWVPSLASADAINKEMTRQGCNLLSDGRPIIGLTSIQVAELVLTIEPKALIIPAHAWTPWFSVYGFMSGFTSIDEAFGPYAKYIFAVETGLSSSPAMNWRIKELDNRAIVSFSDAHSGPKIGREATVFDIPDGKLSYSAIYDAIKQQGERGKGKGESNKLHPQIAYTIEFYPEEGKYHWSGHRTCNIRWGPKEIEKKGTVCPVCGKPLTQGVEQRVGELAGRSEEELKLESEIMNYEFGGKQARIRMTRSGKFPNRPPFVMLVPLMEILSECLGSPVTSNKLQAPYQNLTSALGGEFGVLMHATPEEISKIAGTRVAAGIEKVRHADIVIDPGYDGVFGVVKLWREGEEKPLVDTTKEQLSIF